MRACSSSPAWTGRSRARNFDSGTTAEVVVAPSSAGRPAIYTGLALANMNGGNFLYAANNLTGAVDVFDSICAAILALAPSQPVITRTGWRLQRAGNGGLIS